MSGLLGLITIIFGVIVGKDAGWLNGLLFVFGFFVATGVGTILQKLFRGNLESPFIMLPTSCGIIMLAYWLGSHGSITIHLSDNPINIIGGLWAIVAGPLAGYSLRG